MWSISMFDIYCPNSTLPVAVSSASHLFISFMFIRLVEGISSGTPNH